MTQPGFWDNDQARAQEVTQTVTGLKERIADFAELARIIEDVEVLLDLGEEEDDLPLAEEAADVLADLKKRVAGMELQVLLSGPYDGNNAIVAMHAGAGGTEAQDWVEMLLRMYTRWAEDRKFKVSILDMLPGDEAGVKSVTFEVVGLNAYGYLKSEKGVHRLVRISPFDTAGRRHTSFASVDVLPEVEDDIGVEINADDLRIDTYRSGGAGGQHVNKTDSAVRITHLPTGIVVQCQNERSQLSNRSTAMKMLQSKLVDLELSKRESEMAQVRGEQQDIAWGSQIRSYVFHPYSMVKDHRTGAEVGNVEAVMDGDIDDFINAYLSKQARIS
ncbi:MAG: peptide chain release factor 2 [Peptococcaceae bacterium BRH_c8a]|nr:MAG: peptide chain release factor 2 [Peptococcaceae bacterium BRH_c8a]